LTVVAAVAVVLAGGYETKVAHAVGNFDVPAADYFWPLSWLGFAVVGSLIVMMRPDNRVGWTMVGIGTGAGATLFVTSYARWGYVLEPDALLKDLAGWVSAWLPVPSFGLIAVLILIFPTGRTTMRFTRRVARAIIVLLAALTLWQALTPVTVAGGFANAPKFTNPWAVPALADIADNVTVFLSYLLILLSLLVVVSLPFRLRRSDGVERQQLKAFVFAVSILPFGFFFMGALTSFAFGEQVDTAIAVGTFVVMFNTIAASIAVAVLKHRLYDIDLIINRTLVYGALTAVLVATYALGVLLFRALLDPLTADNDLAIAASTLAVAALFGPARRRIQAFIDFRFYRSRYDARHILDAFSARLRDEVDLDALSEDVLRTLGATVKPRHASLWLAREP
jgi:hypothetical protein